MTCLFIYSVVAGYLASSHASHPRTISVEPEIRAIRVQKPFVFEIQKSSRHAAHHAEAAGDGREHGNDEIDDSFKVSFFIALIF